MKMPPLRSLVLALSLFTLHISLFSSAAAVEDPRLDKILKAHVDAMGGWRAWNKVESIRLSGTIQRDGQEFDFCIIKKRPDQIRATITMPVPGNEEDYFQYISAHDGKSAWSSMRLAGSTNIVKEALSKDKARELEEDAHVLPKLISLWQDGAKLTLQEIHKPQDGICVVKAQNGTIVYLFTICTHTYRTISYTYENLSTGTWQETRFLRYTKVNNIHIPSKIVMDSPETGKSILDAKNIIVGVGVHQEYFSSYTID